METFGDLIDKLTISKIRLEKLREEGHDKEKIDVVDEQCGYLTKEIYEFFYKALKREVILEAPKTKIYHHEKESGAKANNMSEAINGLAEANSKLWDLEDFRRDKSNSDAERLNACDKVSEWNRTRNDYIDLVNKRLSASVLVEEENGKA